MTAAHRRAREHLDKGKTQWRRFLHRNGLRMLQFSLIATDTQIKRWTIFTLQSLGTLGRGSVMVWSGITLKISTELIFIDHGSLAVNGWINKSKKKLKKFEKFGKV
jgi:hypothetical protein